MTKILIGAHCIYSNGTLLGKLGTSLVAMAGYESHIPVIACCETYKFSDKVQLETAAFEETSDPIMLQNPRGGPSAVASGDSSKTSNLPLPPASRGKSKGPVVVNSHVSAAKHPKFLNVVYDITSSKYINVVITEIGLIPCTSIPVVLREYRPFNSM